MNLFYAAYCFLFLTIITILFQLALTLGAPWGSLAMGGKFPGVLPPKIRLVVAIQIIILIFIALVVLTRAGLILNSLHALSEKAIWFVVVFMAISTILNLITPSKWERIIWFPTTIVLLICSLYVALN